MSFQNQFSLSLELTRLLPLHVVADKATEAVMRMVRELNKSGSDVLAEEDLLRIFGYCKIEERMERQFKESMKGAASSQPLCERILLQTGPGPTVVRALQQREYLRLVIQFSLLTSVHEKSSLATAIRRIFDKDAECAPADVNIPTPDENSILGVLTACEEQTTSFHWSYYLEAVARHLGMREMAFTAMDVAIFRGCTRMFPLVQSMPEDRLVVINNQNTTGVCVLAVWAHHILGLTVLVKVYEGLSPTHFVEHLLGTGPPQVIIDTKPKDPSDPYRPSIILLDATDHEKLFKIELDSDEYLMPDWTSPVKGYGKMELESLSVTVGKPAVIEEIGIMVTAFAILVSVRISASNGKVIPREPTQKLLRRSTSQDILRAARFLFDNDVITEAAVEDRIPMYELQPLNETLQPPTVLSIVLDQDPQRRAYMWKDLLRAMPALVTLVLALAYIRNLETCAGVPLSHPMTTILAEHPLVNALRTWDGRKQLSVAANSWFQAIRMLLLGPLPTHSHLESAALTSHRGWSVFLNTLSDRDLHDPSYVDEGFFTVKAGVPSRNGVRKHAIIDGPLVGASSSATAWSISERSGATINGLWDNGAMFVNPMVGENNHSFVVTLGIVSRTGPESTPGTTIRRTGYRELFNAMSGVMKTIDCSHSVINDQPVTLQPGWAASMDINDISPPPPVHEKIVILLTARNRAARWRALIGVSMLLLQHRGTPGARRTMLRSPGCCLRCAVEQTVLEDGLWWLIL